MDVAPLALHVGAGTFQPVKSETIGGHPMHTEVFSIGRESLEKIVSAIREGRKITAVGTTSVRTLESLPYIGAQLKSGNVTLHVDQWSPYTEGVELHGDVIENLVSILDYMKEKGADTLTASTSIMIAPGFKWRIVDVVVTNFHQPQSTLLLLVSSFLDRDPGRSPLQWRRIYDEALGHAYRSLA